MSDVWRRYAIPPSASIARSAVTLRAKVVPGCAAGATGAGLVATGGGLGAVFGAGWRGFGLGFAVGFEGDELGPPVGIDPGMRPICPLAEAPQTRTNAIREPTYDTRDLAIQVPAFPSWITDRRGGSRLVIYKA